MWYVTPGAARTRWSCALMGASSHGKLEIQSWRGSIWCPFAVLTLHHGSMTMWIWRTTLRTGRRCTSLMSLDWLGICGKGLKSFMAWYILVPVKWRNKRKWLYMSSFLFQHVLSMSSALVSGPHHAHIAYIYSIYINVYTRVNQRFNWYW